MSTTTPTIYPSIRPEINRPFKQKLKITKRIINTFTSLFPQKCCVSCSFGKDSMLVLYLVRRETNLAQTVFCNTLCQYPETYKFKEKIAEEWNLVLIETKPKTLWWKIWDKYGAPNGSKKRGKRSIDKCCRYLKETPFKHAINEYRWKANFTGLTALESYQRMIRTCQNGMLYYSSYYNMAKVHPIIFWTEDEVLKFTEEHSIPMNPAYKKRNIGRLGCMICTAHLGWREEILRNNPRLYKWIQERYFGQKTFA